MTLLIYAVAHVAVIVPLTLIIAVITTRTLTDDVGGAIGFPPSVSLVSVTAALAVSVGLGVRGAKRSIAPYRRNVI